MLAIILSVAVTVVGIINHFVSLKKETLPDEKFSMEGEGTKMHSGARNEPDEGA